MYDGSNWVDTATHLSSRWPTNPANRYCWSNSHFQDSAWQATSTLTVTAAGNVGIGTSTPNQKLTVFANAADSAIEFSSASGDTYKWTMGLDYTDGSFRIASSSALGTNDRFIINGKVMWGLGRRLPETSFMYRRAKVDPQRI